MKHAHVSLLEKIYSEISKNNWAAVLDACPDQITFQVPGKSKLAGKYTKNNLIAEFVVKLQELSGGTFQIEVHDILASDRHATVLATDRLTRHSKTIELRTVHVWRFENGQPVAWYEYPRDLYQFDATWAG
jgi:ketosteroid isomerase-like protein